MVSRASSVPSGSPWADAHALLVGAAEGDLGAQEDQSGLTGLGFGRVDGAVDRLQIVAVSDGEHIPAIGLEPKRRRPR